MTDTLTQRLEADSIGDRQMRNSKGSKLSLDYQTPGAVAEVEEEEGEEKKEVKVLRQMDNGLGDICQGHFTIKVTKLEKNEKTGKMEKKSLYENKREPFEYPRLFSLVNALRHAGKFVEKDKFVDMTDEQIDTLGSAIPENFNTAVVRLTKIYNDKLKADAKSAQYTSLVTKYKPLDEEEKEVAIAKIVKGLVKVAPHLSVETVIEILKGQKAIPEDYTVEDFNDTKLRKTKGDSEEEDDE